jgi:hypothetical protein
MAYYESSLDAIVAAGKEKRFETWTILMKAHILNWCSPPNWVIEL